MKKQIPATCDPNVWQDLKPSIKLAKILRCQVKPSLFWKDPTMGNASLWPAVEEILDKFYEIDPKTLIRVYTDLLLQAGRGSGKTYLLGSIGGIEFFRMNSMLDPQKHYKLSANSEIQIINCAPKYEQAKDTIFSKFIEMMRNSPYLMSQRFDYVGDKITFQDKNISFQPFGSNSTTAVGRNVKAFLADEVSYFTDKDSKRSAKEVWDELSASTRRFRTFNEDINCGISAPLYLGDFITSERAKVAELNIKGVLSLKKAVWDMDPKVTRGDFAELERRDPEAFMRMFGAEPSESTERFFSDHVMAQIRPLVTKNNWFGENGRIINMNAIVPDPRALGYIIAADPSAKNDTFGLAVGHYYKNWQIVIDGVTSFKAKRPGELINTETVRKCLDVITSKVNVKQYIFDVYLHSELLQWLRPRGIATFQHFADRTDYSFMKEDLLLGQSSIPHYDQLIQEMIQLLDIKQTKVDHPPKGSKDAADAVCQIISYIRRWQENAYTDNRKKAREQLNKSKAAQLGLFLGKFI